MKMPSGKSPGGILVLPDTQDERNENQIIDMGKNTGKIV